MCSEGWSNPDSMVNGACPVCGNPTVDGKAQSGCYYSPTLCDTCEDSPCDQSC